MAWMSMLYRTYENNLNMVGEITENLVPLATVSHSVENAHLTILLSEDGEFLNATEIGNEGGKTIIPVTEDSASRSSGVAPHGLCDQLPYVAGDFSNYLKDNKGRATADKKFNAYISRLNAWKSSAYSHPVVRVIYTYLAKGELMKDLIASKLVTLDEKELLDNGKISKVAYEKTLVRFSVQIGERIVNSWEDKTLFDSFANFYQSSKNEKAICYLSGEEDVVTDKHPKGIVSASYGAKLISANDKTNYTFKGRFKDSDEALTLSYEASQKAHLALTWLSSNQGINIGKKFIRTYICWNPNCKKAPQVLGKDDFFRFDNEDENDIRPNTMVEYKKNLFKALKGYKDALKNNDEIIIISLEAATTGRLSVTYYNELMGSDFLDRIDSWGNSFNWRFTRKKKDEQKAYSQIETPTLENTIKFAFGVEQGNFVEVADKVLRENVQRLLHAMLSDNPIPSDIMQSIVSKASNPNAYSSYWNYENLLATACAVVSKHKFKVVSQREVKEFKTNYSSKGLNSQYYIISQEDFEKGVKFDMSFEQYQNDRSFLFGQLLAIFDRVERVTYQRGEERPTNAQKLQSMYINYPMKMRMTIEEQLRPYINRLSKPEIGRDGKTYIPSKFYEDLISEIDSKLIQIDKNDLNKRLDESYLLGYYLQRESFYKSKGKIQNQENEEEE